MTSKILLAGMIAVCSTGARAADESGPWFDGSYDEAVAAAAEAQKPVLLYFWWEGSEHAARMRSETLQHPKVAAALKGYVCWDAKHAKPGVAEMFKTHNVDIAPTLYFLGADGQPEDVIKGVIEANELVRDLERIESCGEGTVTGLRRAITETKETETAAELSMQLAGKFGDLGDQASHDATILSIVELDPKATTVGGCRAALMQLTNALYAEGEGDGECADGACEGEECAEGASKEGASADGECEGESCEEGECPNEAKRAHQKALAQEWDLKPFYSLAKKAKAREGRFEVWDQIASLESTRGEDAKCIAALTKAQKELDEANTLAWSHTAAQRILELEGKRSGKDRKFVLGLARRAVELADAKRSGADEQDGGWNSWYADHLITLARALDLNGKRKDAIATCEEALALHSSEGGLALLTSLKG